MSHCSTTSLSRRCMCTLFLFLSWDMLSPLRYPEISWVRSSPLALYTLFIFLRYPERILFTLQSLAAPHLDWKVREVNSSWSDAIVESGKVGLLHISLPGSLQSDTSPSVFAFSPFFILCSHSQYKLLVQQNKHCQRHNGPRNWLRDLGLNLVTTLHHLH